MLWLILLTEKLDLGLPLECFQLMLHAKAVHAACFVKEKKMELITDQKWPGFMFLCLFPVPSCTISLEFVSSLYLYSPVLIVIVPHCVSISGLFLSRWIAFALAFVDSLSEGSDSFGSRQLFEIGGPW